MTSDAEEHDPGHHEHDHEHDGPKSVRCRLVSLLRPHRHDAAAIVDQALEDDARGVRALKVSLLALGLTALIQFGLVLITGSVALLSDTLHNGADALTALPIWLAFSLGRRAATRRFQFGYGRAEDIAGLVVVLFIAASAVVAAYEAIDRLLHPAEVRLLWVVAVAGVVGFIGNELVAQYRIRVGRAIGSAALVADGFHARADGFTSLGVVAGAVGVAVGFPAADPIAGLLIAVTILFVLRDAASSVFLRIMDAVDPVIVDETESVLRQVPGVLGLGSVRLRWIGHRLHAETNLVVDRSLSVIDAHAIASVAKHQLLHQVPKLATATVHVSPAGPEGEAHHAQLEHHR